MVLRKVEGEAVKRYRLAAEQGDAKAQTMLGAVYFDCSPQDCVLAYFWFNLAAAAGDRDAANNRDFVAERMTPNQIAEAERLAREWQPKPGFADLLEEDL